MESGKRQRYRHRILTCTVGRTSLCMWHWNSAIWPVITVEFSGWGSAITGSLTRPTNVQRLINNNHNIGVNKFLTHFGSYFKFFMTFRLLMKSFKIRSKVIAVNMDRKKCGTFSSFRWLSPDTCHINILRNPNKVDGHWGRSVSRNRRIFESKNS